MSWLNPFSWFRWNNWRTHSELGKNMDSWDEKTKEQLMEDIRNSVNGETRNIMFVGCVASGKSCTINSFFSILYGRRASRANSGSINDSYTSKYTQIPCDEGSYFQNIIFYDTPGVSEKEEGTNANNIENATRGSIIPGGDMNEESSTNYAELEIHCIVYVFDAELVQNGIKQAVRDKLDDIKRQLRSGPTRVVLITKVDNICKYVRNDIKYIFSSPKVEKIVETTSAIMGIDTGNIFPIKNYVEEQNVSPHKSIPLLLALKKVVEAAKDHYTGMKENNFTRTD